MHIVNLLGDDFVGGGEGRQNACYEVTLSVHCRTRKKLIYYVGKIIVPRRCYSYTFPQR